MKASILNMACIRLSLNTTTIISCVCVCGCLRFWVVLCFGMLFIITMFLWLFLERLFSIQRCGSVQRDAMQFCHHGSIWWSRAGHFRSDGPPPVYKKLDFLSIIVEYNSLNESIFYLKCGRSGQMENKLA